MLYGVSSNWNSFDYNRWSLDPEGILDYIHESRFGHWSASHTHRILGRAIWLSLSVLVLTPCRFLLTE